MTPDYYQENPWLWILTALVMAIADGRATRLIVHEDFPPAKWLRHKVIQWTKGGDWSAVVTCHWCNTPYLVAISIIWFSIGLWAWEPLLWAWWAVHGWAAVAYAASWAVHHDEDGGSTP